MRGDRNWCKICVVAVVPKVLCDIFQKPHKKQMKTNTIYRRPKIRPTPTSYNALSPSRAKKAVSPLHVSSSLQAGGREAGLGCCHLLEMRDVFRHCFFVPWLSSVSLSLSRADKRGKGDCKPKYFVVMGHHWGMSYKHKIFQGLWRVFSWEDGAGDSEWPFSPSHYSSVLESQSLSFKMRKKQPLGLWHPSLCARHLLTSLFDYLSHDTAKVLSRALPSHWAVRDRLSISVSELSWFLL